MTTAGGALMLPSGAMAGSTYAVSRTRIYDAPRPLVWALVADTNRWDRALGLTAGRYAWREIDGVRVRTASATEFGFAIEWIEPPYRWVEGRFVNGERTFLKGPTSTGGFRARLYDGEGGTRVDATAYVTASGPLGLFAGTIMRFRFWRALDRYLDGIGEVLKRAPKEDQGGEPAVTQARRALMGAYDAMTSGARTSPNLEVLERRARAFDQTPVPPPLRELVVALLRDRPDEEVAQIRPFELARVWGVDRRQTLAAFLHATVSGLTELKWQINCPVCRVSASVVSSLESVGRDVHCEACNIGYDLDFGKHVEAVFQSSPAIRRVDAAVYCASSPAFLPHVLAQLALAPGEKLSELADVPEGAIHMRLLGAPVAADVEVADDDSDVRVVIRADAIHTEASAAESDEATIEVVNESEKPITLLVERAGWNADAVLGSVVASFPEFVDLFATEAPAAGLELSIGHMALVFSDLTGSTALYERIGDAKAFAMVEEHFRLMDAIVREHDGAIVKTMGDAVMAAFAAPANAVRAALDMSRKNSEAFGAQGLAVRVGVHSGPCLGVRANDRLDFFGTTVNIAARLEGKAKAGQVVVMADLASDPAIARLLDGYAREAFEADLKGITASQKLVAISADVPSPR